MRRAVVLPEPDGPTSTMNSPGSTVRSWPSTAGATPAWNVLVAPAKTTSAMARSHRLRHRVVRPHVPQSPAELAAQHLLSRGAVTQLVQRQQSRTDDRW